MSRGNRTHNFLRLLNYGLSLCRVLRYDKNCVELLSVVRNTAETLKNKKAVQLLVATERFIFFVSKFSKFPHTFTLIRTWENEVSEVKCVEIFLDIKCSLSLQRF